MKELSYREILLKEFSYRKRKNQSYSLRAFARDIGVPAPKLSEALNCKTGFSGQRAAQIAEKLRLSKEEGALFVSLVEQEHGRSRTARNQAKARTTKLLHENGFKEIDLARFKIISDWYHFAILELADVQDFHSDVGWIARRLKLSPSQVREALDRLSEFGLLEIQPSGRWVQTQADLATPNGVPSREIREQQSQLLNLALESLDRDAIPERDFSTLTLAFDSLQMERAKQLIREFRRSFNREMGAAETKNRVYCLSLQFFPLDHNKLDHTRSKKGDSA